MLEIVLITLGTTKTNLHTLNPNVQISAPISSSASTDRFIFQLVRILLFVADPFSPCPLIPFPSIPRFEPCHHTSQISEARHGSQPACSLWIVLRFMRLSCMSRRMYLVCTVKTCTIEQVLYLCVARRRNTVPNRTQNKITYFAWKRAAPSQLLPATCYAWPQLPFLFNYSLHSRRLLKVFSSSSLSPPLTQYSKPLQT